MLLLSGLTTKLKSNIQRLANRVGYRIEKIRHEQAHTNMDVFSLVLRDYMRGGKRPFVVQVGANDGNTADPVCRHIAEHRLPALLIEPQPPMFERLRETYREQPQVILEQALLADGSGERQLYMVRTDGPSLPPWCHQIASLDRDLVVGLLREHQATLSLPADVDSLVCSVAIPARSFDELFARHAITNVDVLVIDTMGFDFEILKLYPFHRTKPAIVSFEDTFLKPEDKVAAYRLLQDLGYGLAKAGVDTVGYLGSARLD